MLLKQLPNLLDIQCMTFKSYMKSRNILSFDRVFVELYSIAYEMPATLSEIRRCENDAVAYRNGGPIPVYILKGLEKVRKYQIEVHARSPTT